MSKLFTINVGKDEDIKEKINDFMIKKDWRAAYISGAIGSAKDLQFNAPVGTDMPLKIETTTCSIPGEILSFTGEIMKSELMDPALKAAYSISGTYFIHIHASVAVAGGHVFGGGLKAGKALRAVNIFIQEMPAE